MREEWDAQAFDRWLTTEPEPDEEDTEDDSSEIEILQEAIESRE